MPDINILKNIGHLLNAQNVAVVYPLFRILKSNRYVTYLATVVVLQYSLTL